jgi:energy-coupling factor transporter ATP-binding protein EcfA2
MKFLGIEVEDFACFKRQFVRLQPGINLLVGRNNSGKTAILRVLPLLRNALADFRTSGVMSLAPYARGSGPNPFFGFTVLFELEACDPPIFDPQQSFDWEAFVDERQPVVALVFRMWAAQNLLAFRGCEVRVAGWPALPLIEVIPQGANSIYYVPPFDLKVAPKRADHLLRGLRSGGTTTQPDGTQAHVKLGSPWLSGMDQIRLVRFAMAHRLVTEELPLATTDVLADDARDLATYLQTLQTKDRKRFQAVEEFIVLSFPEFERVDPASENGKAMLRLVRKGTEKSVSLAYCGTGVEQLLALAAKIATSKPGEIVLIDEPHSFLHPAAERAFLRFLGQYADRFLVVATHSSILINGVPPDRIIYLQDGGRPYQLSARPSNETSMILHDLGYRNSDALFFDKLIVVEGPSDGKILPRLISLREGISAEELGNTGFPSLEGVSKRTKDIQTKILQFEKLLGAVGRAKMPRLYLLDGDREPADKTLLKGTHSPVNNEIVDVRFLRRMEIENYLLVPAAITKALCEEAALVGVTIKADAGTVTAKIEQLLSADDKELFPRGKGELPESSVKGSKLLERLYDNFGGLSYDKKRSGAIIAKHIDSKSAIGLDELADSVHFA